MYIIIMIAFLHCWLGDMKGIWPYKGLLQQFPKVPFWGFWGPA